MKVSIALHLAEIDPRGNQRQAEASYQNYNRQYADLIIDATTGDGSIEFDAHFPVAGEPFNVVIFSVGVCTAPPDLGGSVIISGPITDDLRGTAGNVPSFKAAALVERNHLLALDLIVQEASNGAWREKTEDELRAIYQSATGR